jgi:signal transduction histidine kinase
MNKPRSPALPSVDMATFLASSAHDMKNSICLLIRGLEGILGTVDPKEFAAYDDLAQMTYEAKRVNSNLIQLLTLYKIGQEIYPFDPRPVTLSDFIDLIAAQSTELLKSQGVALEFESEPDLYWDFDEDLIAGIIGNAFNNAIHYTHDQVRLSAARVDDCLELRIEDNGTGYPQHMLDECADSMRGVDFASGSTGLGLYFSAIVARMHRQRERFGEIRLENGGTLGGGCFILRLP